MTLLLLCEGDSNMVIAILDDLNAQLKEIEHDFTARFNRMLAGINRYQLQATALHNALRPEEHPFNSATLEQIENLDDLDHQ